VSLNRFRGVPSTWTCPEQKVVTKKKRVGKVKAFPMEKVLWFTEPNGFAWFTWKRKEEN